MTNNRAENMRRLNEDPEFAAARDERSRARFTADNGNLQRLSNIAKRGCDVPDWREGEWQAFKQAKYTNREAADAMGIPFLGVSDDEIDNEHKLTTCVRIEDEQIDYIERMSLAGRIDPDIAYEVIERCKVAKRVLAWNTTNNKGKS